MRYLILLCSLVIFNCSSKPKDCQRFKTGTFVYEDNLALKDFIVERNDSMQVEINELNNSKIICKIKWLSDCKYIVTPIELINYPKDAKIVPMEVEIIETNNNSYKFISAVDTLLYELKMKKIK